MSCVVDRYGIFFLKKESETEEITLSALKLLSDSKTVGVQTSEVDAKL
jgi:hypothetical protein